MNLPNELRESARCIRHDLGVGAFVDLELANADPIDLAADIIDSLPKAEDGSVIWKGCWAVWANRLMTIVYDVTPIADVDAYSGVVSVPTHDRQWTRIKTDYNWIASTHRTREEAEAAAASKENEL